MKNAILDYCEENGINIDELAEITDVSVPQLYLINKDPLYNVTIVTINKIYVGTKRELGKGLSAYKYLDHDCFKTVVQKNN